MLTFGSDFLLFIIYFILIKTTLEISVTQIQVEHFCVKLFL